jgi:hypothetical protein
MAYEGTERRGDGDFRERFGKMMGNVETLQKDIEEIKNSVKKISDERFVDKAAIEKVQSQLEEVLRKLDEHITKDVPFLSIVKDKWAYVSLAAVGYILWQLFTMYADRAVVRVDTIINPPPARQPYNYNYSNTDGEEGLRGTSRVRKEYEPRPTVKGRALPIVEEENDGP